MSHHRLQHARRLAVVALVVFGLVPFTTPVVADDKDGGPEVPNSELHDGWIHVPTHPLSRVFSATTLTGITHDILPVRGQSPFELKPWSGSGGLGTCVGATCVQTGDFDLVFLRENADGTTTLVERHVNVGDESGRVPKDATLAIVFLTTPTLDPGVRGHHYLYAEGNPGSDVVPQR